MKTKISIEIHKSASSLLMQIADFVGQHNESKKTFTPNFIEAYLDVKKFESPSIFGNTQVERVSENEITLFFENSPFVTLTWKEVTELNTISEMDLVTVKS